MRQAEFLTLLDIIDADKTNYSNLGQTQQLSLHYAQTVFVASGIRSSISLQAESL